MTDHAPKQVGTMIQIENVRLEEFEAAVYRRDHERAGVLLLKALRQLKMGAAFVGYPHNDTRLLAVLYTRLAAAVVALLADPGMNLSQPGFDAIAAEHATMDMLFRASAFGASDHLMAQFAQPAAGGGVSMAGGQGLFKFLLTFSHVSGLGLDFDESFRRNARAVLPLWAGMLTHMLTIAPKAQTKREALLSLHEIFGEVDVPDPALPALSDVYMYTSYSLRRDKHEAKATILRMISRSMRARGVELPTAQELTARRARGLQKKRPTVLVCVEWFSSVHAMYRCYAPFVRQLRKRFRVVGMGRNQDVDGLGKAEFDQWVEISAENLSLLAVAETINELAPDMIWYPSIGMAVWWVAMASARLAPVQFMTLGHPASSRSPEIDYVLCDDGAIGDPSLFTERIVTYPDGAGRFAMRPDASFPAVAREDEPEVLHVAVPAMLCKLNAPFMETLREIEQQWKARATGRTLQFHFFVNMIGLNLFQATREIREYLPTALVYERADYPAYLQHLVRCHVMLSTFPFGGTNSVVDSMLLGLPVVTLWGDEPHERFDGMLLRRARLPEDLIAKTRDEYQHQALRLFGDDAYRNQLRDHLLQFDLQGEFFGEHGDAFLHAVECIFNNHEAAQRCEKRVFLTNEARDRSEGWL